MWLGLCLVITCTCSTRYQGWLLVWRSVTGHVLSRHEDSQTLGHWNQPMESDEWNVSHTTNRQVQKQIDGEYDRQTQDWKIPETIKNITPSSNGKARNWSSTTQTRSPRKRPKVIIGGHWTGDGFASAKKWTGASSNLISPKSFPSASPSTSTTWGIRRRKTWFRFSSSTTTDWISAPFSGVRIKPTRRSLGPVVVPCTCTQARGKVRSREIKWRIWREKSRGLWKREDDHYLPVRSDGTEIIETCVVENTGRLVSFGSEVTSVILHFRPRVVCLRSRSPCKYVTSDMGWTVDGTPAIGPDLEMECYGINKKRAPFSSDPQHNKNYCSIRDGRFFLSCVCNWRFTNINKAFENVVGSRSHSIPFA